MIKNIKLLYSYVSLYLILIVSSFVCACEKSETSLDQTTHSSSSSIQFAERSFYIIHPCTNYGFKRAFHEPDVACGFLNTILELSGTNTINKIQFLDKHMRTRIYTDYMVDMLCETMEGNLSLIEVKIDYHVNYETKPFTEFCDFINRWDEEVIHQEVEDEPIKQARLSKAHNYVHNHDVHCWKDIKTALVLVMTNKHFPAEQQKVSNPEHTVMEPDIINTYRMMHENRSGRPLGDLDARVIIVMLSNFHKTETELVTPLDQWLYAFKDETLEDIFTLVPLYKHINDASRVGIDSNLGIARFYNILSEESVRKAGHLEYLQRNFVETSRILGRRDEENRLIGKIRSLKKIKSISEIKTDLTVRQIQILQSKSDKEMMEDMEINEEQLTELKEALKNPA